MYQQRIDLLYIKNKAKKGIFESKSCVWIKYFDSSTSRYLLSIKTRKEKTIEYKENLNSEYFKKYLMTEWPSTLARSMFWFIYPSVICFANF